jgi:hypothetical protein
MPRVAAQRQTPDAGLSTSRWLLLHTFLSTARLLPLGYHKTRQFSRPESPHCLLPAARYTPDDLVQNVPVYASGFRDLRSRQASVHRGLNSSPALR